MDTDFTCSPNELMRVLGTGQAPRLLDVCLVDDIAAAPWRVPTARHVPHGAVLEWARSAHKDTRVVVICQKGLKLSHGAAARLRTRGFHARVLEGGNQAWFAAHHPRLALTSGPANGAAWVLPAPATPRALCLAWLIHRWFDPDAEIMWVPHDMVADVAQRFDAQATPPRLTELCQRVGLDHAPLVIFASQIDANMGQWLPLLTALTHLHHSSARQALAALPIIDAAWVAAREAAQ
jgi:rhodanese-related sulfurtransferase